MKLSIWEQFSSNHSSHFTIVGEFASRTDAEKAAATIRDILKRIADWNAAHYNDDEMEAFWSSGDWWEHPTPIEQAIAAEYGIEWPGAIDWSHNPQLDIKLDRLLFIQPGARPESAGHPFEKIIDRLGGQGYLEGDVYGDTVAGIIFDLICTAPDEATADALYHEYLGFNRRIKRDNLRLHFYRWRFDEEPDFLTLIDELGNANCTPIEYHFTQLAPTDWKQLHNQDDLEVMLEILQTDTDSDDQLEAIHLLSDIRDKRAVEPLIAQLQSSDEWLRRAAASALSKFGDARAVEPLINLLSDPDILTKQVAIAALGSMKDNRAVPPLIEMLHERTLWRYAANSLGQLGEMARPFLRRLLNTEDQIFNARITTALERVDETVKGGDLLTTMRSPQEDERHIAFEQLKQQSGYPETLLTYLHNPGNAMDSWLEDQVINELIAWGDPRVAETLVDSYPHMGTKAIDALARLGPSATNALMRMHQSQSEVWIRQSILNALAQIADVRAYDLLVEALSSRDNIDRRIAAKGLGGMGDSRAIHPLIETLIRGWNVAWHPDTENMILQAIQQLHGINEMVEALLERLKQPSATNGNVIYLLGEFADHRAIEPLHQALSTADEPNRLHIERAIAKIQNR